MKNNPLKNSPDPKFTYFIGDQSYTETTDRRDFGGKPSKVEVRMGTIVKNYGIL